MAGPAARNNPWGRVGLGRTAYQPMDSKANAWAWRRRLAADEANAVIEATRPVAERFYGADELVVDRAHVA